MNNHGPNIRTIITYHLHFTILYYNLLWILNKQKPTENLLFFSFYVCSLPLLDLVLGHLLAASVAPVCSLWQWNNAAVVELLQDTSISALYTVQWNTFLSTGNMSHLASIKLFSKWLIKEDDLMLWLQCYLHLGLLSPGFLDQCQPNLRRHWVGDTNRFNIRIWWLTKYHTLLICIMFFLLF